MSENPEGLHTLLVDCDGVLTDGRLHIDHTGEKMFKSFHTRDVRAIREFTSVGWEVYIVTADDWQGVFHFASKVGAHVLVSRDKSKIPAIVAPYVAIGDDAWDVGMLKKAKMAYAPMDADMSVKAIEGIRLTRSSGGQGIVAEVLRDLCRLKIIPVVS